MTALDRNWKRTIEIVLGDLHLFLSLCIARYLVWRELVARKRAERGASGGTTITEPMKEH